MAKADDIAEKIARKAAELLSPLQLEMDMMKWPPEFRVIMWNAVAQHASLLAHDEEQKR